MEQLQQLISTEEARLQSVVMGIRSTLSNEEMDRHRKEREIADLKQQKLDAIGWHEKRDIDELIDSHVQQKGMRLFQDNKVLAQPYFGVLELKDGKFGHISVCVGRQPFFAGGKALVIDWRDAPISRLYYEYESGEFYEEDIRGQERSGTIKAKRQVETAKCELSKITDKDVVLVRNGEGWHRSGDAQGVIFRKEEAEDHRLPEITALIDRDQFRAISSAESSIVLLQGGAGSGKTTVALHRIAYLNFQDVKRFAPANMLVLVFNKSLQKYLSRVLPDLGVEGVRVDTYHAWAIKIFRAAGMSLSFSTEEIPGPVARLKKSAFMLTLIERHLDFIANRAIDWLTGQLGQYGAPVLATVIVKLRELDDSAPEKNIAGLYKGLNNASGTFGLIPQELRDRIFPRLIGRLNDHEADLRAALSDRDLLEATAASMGLDVSSALMDQLIAWQEKLGRFGKIDFADSGILLWLLQKKGVPAALPQCSHVMVDEAQDFSELELATLIGAADKHQSVTICGDMAQKIKGEFDFSGSGGFAGFIESRRTVSDGVSSKATAQVQMGDGRICADSLAIGYRTTRPIMEAAWRVLGEKPSMKIPRDGEPVHVIQTASYQESLERARDVLATHMKKRPKSLLAVIALYPKDADRLFEGLKVLGLHGVRRHSRDDFTFSPGIIVTSAHQVKGLEFSGVLVFNPSASQYRDSRESRMLLHVVFTRAADHLWIVGHQQMAYGLGVNA